MSNMPKALTGSSITNNICSAAFKTQDYLQFNDVVRGGKV